MLQQLIKKYSLEKYWPYLLLMRFDKPIGILLLLWPTWWALWLAAEGRPSLKNLIVFTLGVVLMRAAGCVINDYADKDFDGHVNRTKTRPLATGAVSKKAALILLVALLLLASSLLLLLDRQTIMLALVAALLAAIYPFMKRYTYLPQVVLGAAFAWAIPMAFSAEKGELTELTWLVFSVTLLWVVVYDTMYAMVDRADDIKIGIKSTAILFGSADRIIIAVMQLMVMLGLVLMGYKAELGVIYYVAVMLVLGLFIYQQKLIIKRKPEQCFKAFLNNNWVGVVVWLGILLN